jgi:predicted metal-dependent phosphoesterase TrpH
VEGVEIHILGYLFDDKNPRLSERLQDLCNARRVRVQGIVQKLNEAGVEIRLDRVMQMAQGSSVGRPHIAQVLLAEEYVQTFAEAFDKYLGNDRPYYLPVERLPSQEAIQLVREAGGITVMAHPGSTGHDTLIPQLAAWGLDGLEVFYPKQSFDATSRYKAYCQQYNMLLSGGSDAHGMPDTFAEIGTLKLTYQLLEKMRERIRDRNGK